MSSVCLSVTFRYAFHIVWNMLRKRFIITRLIGLKLVLGLTPSIGDLVQREHPKIMVKIGVGLYELSTKTCNISETVHRAR